MIDYKKSTVNLKTTGYTNKDYSNVKLEQKPQ